jgi:hypothetical protein
MQLSALQIFFFALAILGVAMLALIRDTFKRRSRKVNKAKAETAARLGPPPSPADHAPAKIQPIDGLFSKRRSESKTWPAANPMSIVHAGARMAEPPVLVPAPKPEVQPKAQPILPAQPKPQTIVQPKAQTSASTALMLPPVTVDALLWERLLALPTPAELRAVSARRLEPPPVPSVETRFEVVSSSGPLGMPELPEIPEVPEAPRTPETPVGMIEEPVLKEMLARTKLFTGLVVSIGLNEPDDGVWRGEGLYQSITNFVASVLGKGDFGCRTAIDEFLIVVPGKQESDAQNHLNYIADRLWDFQLRGIGACAILFSWGGATANGQSLSSAIASATQRMRQAKQRRNPLPVRSLGGYRRAN